MFDTNDIYNEARRNSSIYRKRNRKSNYNKALIRFNVITLLLLISIVYIGFYLYSAAYPVNKDENIDFTLVIQDRSLPVSTEYTLVNHDVTVEKDDILEDIFNKSYMDDMNHKRIIASNDNLNTNDSINLGETILFPY